MLSSGGSMTPCGFFHVLWFVEGVEYSGDEVFHVALPSVVMLGGRLLVVIGCR